MKPTPRTDAMVGEEHCEGLYQRVEEYHTLADFARDLERQLSDALEREKALRQELAIEFGNSDRLAKALSALVTEYEGLPRSLGYEFTHLPDARTALALHESGDEPTYTDCPIHGRHEGDCPRC